MSQLFVHFKQFFTTANLKQKGKSLNRNIVRFTLFLFLSASLWFINSLRKSHIDEINYPIEFINIPEGKVVDSSITPQFKLKIKADGFTLARYYFSSDLQPLTVDLSVVTGIVRRSSHGLCISGVALERYLNENVAKDVQVLSVEPDTLFLSFTEERVKKVPIELQLDVKYLKQYNQSEQIVLIPDSLLITGPTSIIDQISSIKTIPSSFKDIKDSIQFSTELIIPEHVMAGNKYCNVIVPVEPFTESKIKVVVKAINLPTNLMVKFFPAEITIAYQVAVSKINTVTPSSFSAEVDFDEFSTISPPEKMRVRVEKSPLYVKDMTYYPLLIDYLMEHKN